MATVILSAAGEALGAYIGGAGSIAAVIGQAAGAAAGSVIDNQLLRGAAGTARTEGPRLGDLEVTTSVEGTGLPWAEGRVRLSGNIIWATRLEEEAATTKSGGKGLGGGGSSVTNYRYFSNFAVALGDCRGRELRHIGRIWADGRILDTSELTIRVYPGSETQAPDPLIEAVEGEAPAYLGTAYVVFERMPLADYGNRIPQLRFECYFGGGDLEDLVQGVDLIPGSTEWGYHPEPVRQVSLGSQGEIVEERIENTHRGLGGADWVHSLDLLQGVCPNVGTVALVVAWFGTDLRAGLCEIKPKVEDKIKITRPLEWSASGVDRAAADRVSLLADGRPAFGSSPADASIVAAIEDLRARGLRVVLYPFILMDIRAEDALAHPSGVGTQGAYPWRGRVEPRASEAVSDEVAAFLGTAAPSDFSVAAGEVTYSGPAEFSYRRFILHLAHLAAAAGGVDAFLVGTEMVGMSTAHAGAGTFPFVDGLTVLAGEVSAILPSASISYAADWSEYHSHRPDDGSGDVWFHLDPFWASADVDFVGIDNYLPISDWREGTDHLDYNPALGHTSPYSLEYLKANIEGGEYFDWFYASAADRVAQIRTPIADGVHGEPWVYRNKDVRGWHGNAHHNRPGGVRDGSATAWIAGSKPVWFTEFGCPAVDFGANQPNVFFSPKSSESFLPHFSTGVRDDYQARQYLRAMIDYWTANGAGIVAPGDMLVWSWDARPFPEFPNFAAKWGDAGDYRLGHWWQGRAGAAPNAEAIHRRLVEAHGFDAAALDLSGCHGQSDGYAAPGPMRFRDWVSPIEAVFALDSFEDGGIVRVRSRSAAPVLGAVSLGEMIDREGAPRLAAARAALEDVAEVGILKYRDGERDYDTAAARAPIEVGPEEGDAEAEVPLVLDLDRATGALETWIRAAADAREGVGFALPPSREDVRPGVILPVEIGGSARPFVVREVSVGTERQVRAVSYDAAAYAASGGLVRVPPATALLPSYGVVPVLLDLPLLSETGEDWRGYAAGHAQPWPGGAELYRSAEELTGFVLNVELPLRAQIGETAADLPAGRAGTISPETLRVRMFSGSLVTRPEADVLAGANALAIQHAAGWEVLRFVYAELVAVQTWDLTGLIRGDRGTEWVRGAADLPAGARVVAIDGAVSAVEMAPSEIAAPFFWRMGPKGADQTGDRFTQIEHAFDGTGRRPFAPAQLTASETGGDLDLTWLRRDRRAGFSLGLAVEDPALTDGPEAYRIEIGPEGAPARVIDVSAPAHTYTAGEQSADALVKPYEIRVHQIGPDYGPGAPARLLIV